MKIPRMTVITPGVSAPDGHYREAAWGPMFDFTEHGDLRFKT
jgi:hypothetical protein